jgi:uncharacterized membrane-anchored protein
LHHTMSTRTHGLAAGSAARKATRLALATAALTCLMAAALPALAANEPEPGTAPNPVGQTPAPTSVQAPAPSPEQDMASAQQQAEASKVTGPADITLQDQAVLKLPAGYLWVPQPAAGKLMHAMGNRDSEALLGLVMPTQNAHWMAVARYEKAGYVKDDEARNWDVDELLKSLKEGTEEANKDRKARGFDELEIGGWVERPHYDEKTHRLIWSLAAHPKGRADDGGINYNTYALGREGYITLNMLTDPAHVEQDKPLANTLLAALQFKDGKRYEDFNSSTDKVAEYGLMALVGGLAAKKLGLFAVAAAFLAKFAKVGILAGIAAAGGLGRFFKKKT